MTERIRRCSALNCKKYKDLQGLQINPVHRESSVAVIPDTVVIYLCPKHIGWKNQETR